MLGRKALHLISVLLGLTLPACDAPADSDETDGATSTATDANEPQPDENGQIDCVDVDGGPSVGGGPLSPTGFPEVSCSPRASGAGSHKCCSDDPATPGGALPAYDGREIVGGTTIFSGDNNALGSSGMCVNTADTPSGSGLSESAAENCPVPCNPTWSDEDQSTVCGSSSLCCQTRELQASDCIEVGGVWRPITGTDVPEHSTWATGEHATHQDPNRTGCEAFVGDSSSAEFVACTETLSVADQRGFCLTLGAGQQCPTDAPGYLDACQQINEGLLPPPA